MIVKQTKPSMKINYMKLSISSFGEDPNNNTAIAGGIGNEKKENE
jgi:hypothetical protein